jgi:hypothetical protein
MQWIENEGGDVGRLTEEKLGVYNEVLGGQVKALEARQRDLVFHPRYRPVVAFKNGLTKPIDVPDKAREIDDAIAAIARCIARMETVKTAADVRAAVAPLRPAVQDGNV